MQRKFHCHPFFNVKVTLKQEKYHTFFYGLNFLRGYQKVWYPLIHVSPRYTLRNNLSCITLVSVLFIYIYMNRTDRDNGFTIGDVSDYLYRRFRSISSGVCHVRRNAISMSTICICNCDVTVFIVMSLRVHNLSLLPEHMVCFCEQSDVEK